jgi:hypothetical protein
MLAGDDSTIDSNRQRGERPSRMHHVRARSDADGDGNPRRSEQATIEPDPTDH